MLGDITLTLTTIPVTFSDGSQTTARAEGNNAAGSANAGNRFRFLVGATSSSATTATRSVQTVGGRTE